MKSKRKETGQDFWQWWNDWVFYANPLYRSYQELHARGADLDYIRFLCGVFKYGERFDPRGVCRTTLRQARKRKKKASSQNDILPVFIRDIERLHFLVEKWVDPMVLLAELTATVEWLYVHRLAHVLKPEVLVEAVRRRLEERRQKREEEIFGSADLKDDERVAVQKILDTPARVCEKLNLLWFPER